MYPVLLKIGPLTIHSYGFMMALGVAFALWFLFVQSKKQGLQAPKMLDMAFYTILVALAGAKLALFLSSFSYYVRYPGELFMLARTGGVFQAGLFFGTIFALFYLRRHRIPTWKAGDIMGTALALGHGFGRIGCFLAGCCFGRECSSPWGSTFHNEYSHNLTGIPLGTPLHPTQLYESALNFINFFVLFFIMRRKKFDGQVFSFYIINYSIIRFVVEYYRGDHPAKAYLIHNPSPFLSLSFPQVFCILGLIAGVILLLVLRKRKSA